MNTKRLIKHPFETIRPEKRRGIFLPLLAGTLLLMLVMNGIGAVLNTEPARYGIISFEFAASQAKAQAMIESWGTAGLVRAAFVQGLDFLFPLVYASALSLGCLMAGDVLAVRKWPLAGAGRTLAWGIWLAAGLDYVENIGLTLLLLGKGGDVWAMLAAVCAALKFGLIFLGLVYAMNGLTIHLAIPKPKP